MNTGNGHIGWCTGHRCTETTIYDRLIESFLQVTKARVQGDLSLDGAPVVCTRCRRLIGLVRNTIIRPRNIAKKQSSTVVTEAVSDNLERHFVCLRWPPEIFQQGCYTQLCCDRVLALYSSVEVSSSEISNDEHDVGKQRKKRLERRRYQDSYTSTCTVPGMILDFEKYTAVDGVLTC